MIQCFLVFLLSLVLSLVVTPVVKKIGYVTNALDIPRGRKVHKKAVPRIGGLAVVFSFFSALLVVSFIESRPLNLTLFTPKTVFFVLGALIIFSVGFFDDYRPLSYRVKFLVQVLAATVAFYGGIRINQVAGIFMIEGLFYQYLFTLFWFLLFINAVNLIDGLDGLATGVSLFASIVMLIISCMLKNLLVGLFFAALAGSLLGFLRYNFNPASIFMGDGGSYFIGYTIAALSIAGSLKCPTSAAFLVPVLAMGVPIFDAIFSPLRRFLVGRRMFAPDRSHIHHRLLDMGLTKKNAVLVLYSISVVLCVSAMMLFLKKEQTMGIYLAVFMAVVFLCIKKMGYLEYLTADKLFGWFLDISDEAGLTKERRTFLGLQMEMRCSATMDELWGNVCAAAYRLHFDRVEFYIHNGHEAENMRVSSLMPIVNERRRVPPEKSSVVLRERPPEFFWNRKGAAHKFSRNILRVELPILNGENAPMGTLVLLRDLKKNGLEAYSLRRVELLRRTLKDVLPAFQESGELYRRFRESEEEGERFDAARAG